MKARTMTFACRFPTLLAFAALVLLSILPAMASETLEEISFDGETITISQTDEGQRAILLGDRELGRNWFAGFDRIAEVYGQPVALFYLGDGGNACAPSTLIVWRSEDGLVHSLDHNEGCGTPAPSVSDNGIVFVPYLLPGESAPVKRWTPPGGIEMAGTLHYAPQPGTGWEEIAAAAATHPLDLFKNEAVYTAALDLVGANEIADYARGLGTASEPQMRGGLLMGSGCVPHNCGGADSLIIADPAARSLYLAQQRDGGIRQWPEASDWPANVMALFKEFAAGRQ